MPVRALALAGCLAVGLAIALVPSKVGTALPAIPAVATERPAGGEPIEAALQRAVADDAEIAAFYKARDFRPLWMKGPAPEARKLAELIGSADVDGLNPEDYGASRIRAALARAEKGDGAAAAEAEYLLSRGYADYARDLRRPMGEVGMIFIDRELAPAPPSVRAALEKAAAAPSLAAHLDAVTGMNPLYLDLRRRLADWRGRWADLPDVTVPAGPALAEGATGDRVRRLRERLGLPAGEVFDGAVAEAVRDFRNAHGLPAGSVADAATIAALNDSPRRYERLIRANLERARALPGDPGRRYILVDAASQRLWMYEDGQPRDSMKVIVGKPGEQTPMMAALIRFTVLNPYWNVPPDLAQKRVAAGVLQNGLVHLKNKRMQVLSGWTRDARVVDPATVNWKAVASGRQKLRVRQIPGADNMMGDMKFMFPNRYGIYLHDTPSKELFARGDRRLSSGCVRVEDAARLARWLYGGPVNVRSAGPEKRLYLRQPVPVYITYLTAAPTAEGIAFRRDIYGRDARLFAALERGSRAVRRA